MKTIEERATVAQSSMPKTTSPFVMFRKGYIAGATEQKTIDIDKVCEWLANDIAHRHELSYWVLEELPMRLKKAMEE